MARYCGHWSDGNTHNSDHPSSHFLPLLVIWTVALLSTHHCWWEDQWRRVQLNMKVIVARSGGARLVTGNFTELHLSMTDRTLPQHLLRGLQCLALQLKQHSHPNTVKRNLLNVKIFLFSVAACLTFTQTTPPISSSKPIKSINWFE